jgi:hypothetical protein
LIGRFKGADPTGFILCSQLFTAALLFFWDVVKVE